ncbi:MAG: zinc ribbon domain-containing protein [Fimbriiglobus sp.]|jgi:putative FmdB family regulatory protein|nr:zinc ribbon domain-containing protein [Fimbriiglobus sp.]
MPTYDYVCDACTHAFEEWQSFHDPELTTCPKCKKKKLRRLIGNGAAIVFKGSGFYETDYNRSADYQKAVKAETESPSTSEAKPAADATPASPPPPPVDPAPAKKSGAKKKDK